MTGLMLLTALGVGQAEPARVGRKALDRQADQALAKVINVGADLYNNQDDAAGCYRLYQGSLLTLRPVLEHRPELQTLIDEGLAEARDQRGADEKAFRLRRVLGRLRDGLNPDKPAAKAAADKKKKSPFTLSEREQAVLELTNKEREGQGLAPLKPSARLFKAARAHSANMAGQNQLGHDLDGKGPGERLEEAGYEHLGWGENVAAGQRTAREALTTWMNSPGHRANILNERFTEIGIGVAETADGVPYYTQVFATPRGR